MATEAALFATFEIERGTADVTDAVFGTITGPIVFADCEQIENGPNSTKYQVLLEYVAGIDANLEYSIFRRTFARGAAAEIDTALATLAGASRACFLRKVSADFGNVTYDIIVIHDNA